MRGTDRKQENRAERGSAVVEASLTLMLFLTVIFSIFDFGFTLFLHQTFERRASAGARYGATCLAGPVTCSLADVKNVVLYDQTTGSGNGIMGLTPSAVQVTRTGASGSPEDRVVVTISGYTFLTITPGWAGSHTGNPIMVTMPIEQ